MGFKLAWCGAVTTAFFMSCGGCDDTPSDNNGSTDTGSEDVILDSSDLGLDTSKDASGDTGTTCGNGVLDPNEICDGTLFLSDDTCGSLGLPDGTISCSDTCELDSSMCAVCDDGICSDGETAATCVQDCGVKSIAAGRTHTCAALADGSLWCWGARDGHRMGGTPDTNKPVRVRGHDNVTQVTAGAHHTCFVDKENEVWCFGANGFGEAGQDPSFEVFPPEMVRRPGFVTGTKVVAGENHTCGISTTDGDVYCWGRGDFGQRGDSTFRMRKGVPSLVTPDLNTRPSVDLALGGKISCTAQDSGGSENIPAVRCWGDNRHGVIYDPYDPESTVWQDQPKTIFGRIAGLALKSVSVGDSHICLNGERTDGTMPFFFCFGGNGHGQLGIAPSLETFDASGLEGRYDPIATGYGYTCAQDLNTPGAPNLLCWGDNYFGQLGDDTLVDRFEPADVLGIDEVTALSGGFDHVCAILPDQTARCWGRNREGQLGNGSEAREHASPVVPIGLGGAK